MHARIITAQLKPGVEEDVTHTFEQEVVPMAQQHPGLECLSLFVDPFTREAKWIALWSSEEGMQAYGEHGLQDALSKISLYFDNGIAPMTQTYEVRVHAETSAA